MSRRFLRWLLADWRRYLPPRSVAVGLLGIAFAILLGEAPDSSLPAVIAIMAAVIAIYPQREIEIKKQLVPHRSR